MTDSLAVCVGSGILGVHAESVLPQIRATAVDMPGVAALLAHAVGPDEHRLERAIQRYRDDPHASLLVAVAEPPAGVVGYASTDNELIVLHIATAPEQRRAGIGRCLLAALRPVAQGRAIVAETDSDALGFYRSNGFTITPLGEKYPGVERFRACLATSTTTENPSGDGPTRGLRS